MISGKSCLDNCAFCKDGLTCETCSAGYRLVNQMGTVSCVACSANFCQTCTPAGCTSCKPGYYLQGSACVPKCDTGFYPSVSYDAATGVPSTSVCQTCDSSCYECIGNGPSFCTSCPMHHYLQFAGPTVKHGTCTLKAGTTTVTMFVSNLAADISGSDKSGTLANPETDLLRAIDRSYEQAATSSSASVHIYLYANGNPHGLTRSALNNPFIPTSALDDWSNNVDITIQPLYCSLGLTADPSKCSTDNTAQVTVNNKIEGMLRMKVPKSLTIKNVIFDSLDSVIPCKIQ